MLSVSIFFFNDTATTEIYALSLHDALPISGLVAARDEGRGLGFDRLQRHLDILALRAGGIAFRPQQDEVLVHHRRSEEHTAELQSPCKPVCRLPLEKTTNQTIVRRSICTLI